MSEGYTFTTISQGLTLTYCGYFTNCAILSWKMNKTKLDKRFFESTRGRIVTLLRGSTQNRQRISGRAELTDNAVRAHLLSLERDGLIKQRGVQKGTRKPHFAYELTGRGG